MMMPDEDVLEEGGLEPAAEPEESTDDAAEASEEAPAAVSFTPEDDLADLGSRYQRFAENHEDPRTARVEYGKHVDHLQSAFGRLSQGGEWTPEDIASAEALGFDVPEPPEEEPVEPIWGAPWAEPTTYDEIAQLATSDPKRAMEFIDAQPEGRIDPDFRKQVLAWWVNPEGGNDPAGMTAYLSQHAETRAETRAREAMEQMREELRQEFAPLQQRDAASQAEKMNDKIAALAARATHEIPDFEEHQPGLEKIMQERNAYDPTYIGRFLELSLDQQFQEISDLVGVAAWRGRSQAEADAAAEVEAAKTAKVTAGSERGRGAAGTPGSASQQSEMKKKFTDDIRKALESPA